MKCYLYRLTTDHEGESKVVLVVPKSELSDVLRLVLLLEQELDVQFTRRLLEF